MSQTPRSTAERDRDAVNALRCAVCGENPIGGHRLVRGADGEMHDCPNASARPAAAGFAVVQYGFCVFGVGATPGEAWQDAAPFMGGPLGVDTSDTPREHGAIYCLPATRALIDAVRREGGAVPFEIADWPLVDLGGGR